ncbi:hypothetical protein CKAN_00737600 [Cinnamomum micranthum f. kanehirae]|uniref:DUF2828 domain-containing protein n=1 Tax=Cinnamomum micranthum f. kanehirae TaxID=337451 RepID=A0A443NJX9_9MAGN|nr:hypothetical protein CKAN_00737600 [Cinnamomum micranthum f. kanehirae]
MAALFDNLMKDPPMGLTENFSPTFLSSGNPCLDFFFHVMPYTPPERVTELLGLLGSTTLSPPSSSSAS